MKTRSLLPRFTASTAALAALMLMTPGCKDNKETPKETPATGATAEKPKPAGGKVALLLPESKTARYETQDRPHFERKVKELCAECEVIY